MPKRLLLFNIKAIRITFDSRNIVKKMGKREEEEKRKKKEKERGEKEKERGKREKGEEKKGGEGRRKEKE